MSKIEFDKDVARDVITLALSQALTPEAKEQLLRQAFADVLSKEEGYKITTIKTLFTEAIKEMARQRCVELLQTDPELAAGFETITRGVLQEIMAEAGPKLKQYFTEGLEQLKRRSW